jgi:hypothetical protein
MLKIDIQTIPHHDQRYETVGDWFYSPDGRLHIRVSELDNWRFEACIAIHELVECVLCRYTGITEAEVDEFDKAFEANRDEDNTDEPGDDSNAPYRTQHCIATGVERVVAALLNVDWSTYDEAVNAL